MDEATLQGILRVAGAAVLAGLIGLEREAHDKPAGFRTHMLTGGAAALLVVLGPFLLKEFSRLGVSDAVMRVDPLCILEAIIVKMLNFGPSTPFIGIATAGLAATCLIVIMAVAALAKRGKWRQLNCRQKSVVVILLSGASFLLWGSSAGQGGPKPGGGTVGYTHGGILHYVSVTSSQPHARAPWSHDLSVRPLPLLGTLALSAAALIGAVFGVPWRTGREPN
ncbi:MAG TPA: MgtC/SapB family protein [Verrucomicrobiales bacterium]|nr:MgtC/SapB family protein [Verrucomicrobiales bacterium]